MSAIGGKVSVNRLREVDHHATRLAHHDQMIGESLSGRQINLTGAGDPSAKGCAAR
jgi:hypothetical protein